METKTSASNYNVIRDQRGRKEFYHDRSGVEVFENNPVSEKSGTDVTEKFSDYIGWLNLAKNPKMMVLSSSSHYYYETEDLEGVEILVNLKQLNDIKETSDFLHNINSVLPLKSYFVGCFFDNDRQNGFLADPHKPDRQIAGEFDPVENGISSRIPFLNMIYDLIDLRTNRYMTKRTVNSRLEQAALKVLDMTEFNGLTFFCAQKNSA